MWEVWLYLAVSVEDIAVQSTALFRIWARPTAVAVARQGLLRTATCRVIAALTYAAIGVLAALSAPQTGSVLFGALLALRLMWQVNALLDSQIASRLAHFKLSARKGAP